jgi:hypothetical protein
MPDANTAHARTLLPLGGYPAILAECRSVGVPDTCRRVLDDCLGHLDEQLRGQGASTDRRSARQTLRELADLIASGRLGLARVDYESLLVRLAAIFATGFSPASQGALVFTAPTYAGVIAAISRACPNCDYEASLGQLLTYMARLFLDRRSGWKAIYRSIQAISDGVAAKQRLDDGEFARIQEWIESGAANLFPIQRDLGRAIGRLGEKVAAIDAQIASHAAALDLASRQRRTDGSLRNVVSLDTWRQGREIAELERQRLDLLDQIEAKQGIQDLIDADIRELEDCLRATRRAYFIRLAWTAA